MASRKERQNLKDAREYFNMDLSKDRNSRYSTSQIDYRMFNLGLSYGFEPKSSLDSVSDEIKNDINYYSYVKGFQHAKRELKNRIDLYNMGKTYYENGVLVDNLPKNYRNNEYFMSGYNEAMKQDLNDKDVQSKSRRK